MRPAQVIFATRAGRVSPILAYFFGGTSASGFFSLLSNMIFRRSFGLRLDRTWVISLLIEYLSRGALGTFSNF